MNNTLLQNQRVLIVDDNVINQMMIKHSLIKLGAITDITSDGKEAIVQFEKKQYDLILMNIQMPVMDGYETTQYIRSYFKSEVPIIAMTAFALKGEDEKCFEYGMNGYVSKPFTLESLYNAINLVFNLTQKTCTNPHVLVGNGGVVVDVSMLYDIMGNDEEYINTMITIFLDHMPVTINKLDAFYHQSDWENVYKSAHYAKSSLSVIKVAAVFECVFKIENNAKNKVNLHEIPALLVQIKQKFAIVENILKERISFKTKSTMA